MIVPAGGFVLPEVPDLAVFADDAQDGLFHVLPMRLAATGADGAVAGQLIVTGRGPPARDDAVAGAFWSLALAPAATAADRDRVAAALGDAKGPARLITAEARVHVEVTLAPGVTARADARDWRGTPLLIDGRAADAATAVALRRAWGAGLPEAAAVMVLTLAGSAQRSFRAGLSRARRIAWDGATTTEAEASAGDVALTLIPAAMHRLTRRFSLALRPDRARAVLFHTGFDPT